MNWPGGAASGAIGPLFPIISHRPPARGRREENRKTTGRQLALIRATTGTEQGARTAMKIPHAAPGLCDPRLGLMAAPSTRCRLRGRAERSRARCCRLGSEEGLVIPAQAGI
jgi:hypothetical protein